MWFRAIIFAILLIVASVSAFGGPVTLSFENLTDGTLLTNQFPDITFENTTIATAGVSLNELEFPPYSGSNVIVNGSKAVTITFSIPIRSFEAYFTYESRLSILAFNLNGDQVGSALSKFESNLALDSASDAKPNEMIGLTSQQGIAKVVISIAASGASFTLDDVEYDSRTVVTVSAASYQPATLATTLAVESIVAAFGFDLATTSSSATELPLPTSLNGTKVKIKDSMGVERPAPLFFASSSQVNYQIPANTAVGEATVTIVNSDGGASYGKVQISSVSPGIFAANSDGQGVAAAFIQRFRIEDGVSIESYEPVARFDSTLDKFVPLPIDLGPDRGQNTDRVYLGLLGTGWRFRSSLSNVIVRIGGSGVEALYAGSQPTFIGLDQINILLPRNLIGRGVIDVEVQIDGRKANTVQIAIGGQLQ
jgi:uncharacterized protein (TIGR03437 family)